MKKFSIDAINGDFFIYEYGFQKNGKNGKDVITLDDVDKDSYQITAKIRYKLNENLGKNERIAFVQYSTLSWGSDSIYFYAQGIDDNKFRDYLKVPNQDRYHRMYDYPSSYINFPYVLDRDGRFYFYFVPSTSTYPIYGSNSEEIVSHIGSINIQNPFHKMGTWNEPMAFMNVTNQVIKPAIDYSRNKNIINSLRSAKLESQNPKGKFFSISKNDYLPISNEIERIKKERWNRTIFTAAILLTESSNSVRLLDICKWGYYKQQKNNKIQPFDPESATYNDVIKFYDMLLAWNQSCTGWIGKGKRVLPNTVKRSRSRKPVYVLDDSHKSLELSWELGEKQSDLRPTSNILRLKQSKSIDKPFDIISQSNLSDQKDDSSDDYGDENDDDSFDPLGGKVSMISGKKLPPKRKQNRSSDILANPKNQKHINLFPKSAINRLLPSKSKFNQKMDPFYSILNSIDIKQSTKNKIIRYYEAGKYTSGQLIDYAYNLESKGKLRLENKQKLRLESRLEDKSRRNIDFDKYGAYMTQYAFEISESLNSKYKKILDLFIKAQNPNQLNHVAEALLTIQNTNTRYPDRHHFQIGTEQHTNWPYPSKLVKSIVTGLKRYGYVFNELLKKPSKDRHLGLAMQFRELEKFEDKQKRRRSSIVPDLSIVQNVNDNIFASVDDEIEGDGEEEENDSFIEKLPSIPQVYNVDDNIVVSIDEDDEEEEDSFIEKPQIPSSPETSVHSSEIDMISLPPQPTININDEILVRPWKSESDNDEEQFSPELPEINQGDNTNIPKKLLTHQQSKQLSNNSQQMNMRLIMSNSNLLYQIKLRKFTNSNIERREALRFSTLYSKLNHHHQSIIAKMMDDGILENYRQRAYLAQKFYELENSLSTNLDYIPDDINSINSYNSQQKN